MKPRAAAGGTAGYSLVVVIMLVTVLNIMLAAALPSWSEMIKRDKEEELISRGWQYAEGIRLFQHRFGRLPVKLEELIKAKPRCIRQLWKDPMTEDGEWDLVFLNQGSPVHVPGQPQTPPEALEPGKPKVQIGPIIGVRSRSPQKSLLVFFGHERYDEWEFRVEWLQGAQARQLVRGVGVPGFADYSTRWLGRPMPDFVPPGGAMPPGPQQPPGIQQPKPPRPGGGGIGRP